MNVSVRAHRDSVTPDREGVFCHVYVARTPMTAARSMDMVGDLAAFGRLQPRHLLDPPSTCGPAHRRPGNRARLENHVMKRVKDMDAVVASVRRLLASGGSELVYGDRLRRALQKFEEAREGGNARRLVRAACEISEIVCDEFLKKK